MDDGARGFFVGVWSVVRFWFWLAVAAVMLYAVVHRVDLVPWQ
jgi:hypothetical protein